MFAVLASSCKDMLNPEEIEKANPGDEVVFGAALPGNSKTVYGEENGNKFPIYWVNGDKVLVASPQCLSGRNSAEYQIAVDGATQNYATSMTKTGDAGVQWGADSPADFYSIYPSSASTKLEVNGESVTTTLHVDATQFARTTDNGTSYYAQPAEMGNVVMYAKKAGVASGATVELHYTPFSTVLEFEINAPSGEVPAGKQTEITIQSLTLTAPTGTTIAGDFGFTFPTGESTTPSIKAATGGSNAITMHFLDNNQYTTELSTTKTTLKAKMCLMPISGNLDGWKIEVNTSAGTFSKTLGANDSKGTATTLDPGKVHKIKLPALNYGSKEWVYSLDRWIPTLPDYTNIYLSEISLPGAWYAGATEGVSNGTGYQATSSITDLWNAGVRAFAMECRTSSTQWNGTPQYLCISGTGRKVSLADWFTGGTNITTILDGISTALASHQDEYAVLVLSYADGGDGGHRPEDHAYFLEGVANALSGYTDIVYSGTITKNTTIGDVKGKLIVKINIDAELTLGNYKAANALISYNPFPLQITSNTNTDLNGLSVPYFSNLSWSTWGDDTETHRSYFRAATAQAMSDPFVWCFSSANRTDCTNTTSEDGTVSNTEVATLSQRKAALKAMSVYSKQIYDNSTHNVWFYYNCGGTHATVKKDGNPSPTKFAQAMNPWLLSTINAKTDPSPLGIVMFNQCTGDNATYHGEDIIRAIIEMNSKFYLKHAGTSGGSTGGDATPAAENDATVGDGGEAI